MSPKAKVDREAIAEAAFALIRREGHEALTARRLAEALQCSTQPLLYRFASIQEIQQEAYRRADRFHTDYLMRGLEAEADPLLALGLPYIRFGAEEKALFRFLFQSGQFSGKSPEDLTAAPDASPLIDVVAASMNGDRERAQRIFEALFAAVHGYASLLANNAMAWDPAAAKSMLTLLGQGLFQS